MCVYIYTLQGDTVFLYMDMSHSNIHYQGTPLVLAPTAIKGERKEPQSRTVVEHFPTVGACGVAFNGDLMVIHGIYW